LNQRQCPAAVATDNFFDHGKRPSVSHRV